MRQDPSLNTWENSLDLEPCSKQKGKSYLFISQTRGCLITAKPFDSFNETSKESFLHWGHYIYNRGHNRTPEDNHEAREKLEQEIQETIKSAPIVTEQAFARHKIKLHGQLQRLPERTSAKWHKLDSMGHLKVIHGLICLHKTPSYTLTCICPCLSRFISNLLFVSVQVNQFQLPSYQLDNKKESALKAQPQREGRACLLVFLFSL